jgi:mono/diheme cytochrome c family protein
MELSPFPAASILLMSVAALSFSMPAAAYGQASQTPDPTNAGKAVFSKANCVGCHKWHGHGGGGYGGDALSLRKTELTREQIIETVAAGGRAPRCRSSHAAPTMR